MDNPAMTTTHPLRLNQRAKLVPVAQFEAWHAAAITVPGLTPLDRGILDAVAGCCRR
jgi:hypothetical protein